MPHGRVSFDPVSEFDRGRIVASRDCGLSFRQIRQRVGRNQATVMWICHRCKQADCAHGSEESLSRIPDHSTTDSVCYASFGVRPYHSTPFAAEWNVRKATLSNQRFISEMLQPVVLFSIQRWSSAIFQQDNALPHMALNAQESSSLPIS
ncbi:HTH_38 domain-containing protein [Trichonephila clavipes]|nr:HTH_38 domain-containing protein [Trichonephila clavipes]